jgi:hypothetical protein
MGTVFMTGRSPGKKSTPEADAGEKGCPVYVWIGKEHPEVHKWL